MYLTKEHLRLSLKSFFRFFCSPQYSTCFCTADIPQDFFLKCASVAPLQYLLCIWYAGLGCDPLNSSHDRAVWKRWDTSSAEGLLMKDSPGLWESHERQRWGSWRRVLYSLCIQSNRQSFSLCLWQAHIRSSIQTFVRVCLYVCVCRRLRRWVGTKYSGQLPLN